MICILLVTRWKIWMLNQIKKHMTQLNTEEYFFAKFSSTINILQVSETLLVSTFAL